MPPVPLVLDTDIGTDVDDALALAFVIRHPGLDLRAVTTVSGNPVRRAKIAAKLLLLAGRDDVEVAAGLTGEQSQPDHSAEGGHEDAVLGDVPAGLRLSDRGGVDVLLDLLVQPGMQCATVGMQSNLAAAVIRDPSLPERLALLAVMGGVFAPVCVAGRELSPSIDHNLNVDQQASLVALNAGFETLYVPCDVTFNTFLTVTHLERLRSGDALCRELARQVDIEARRQVSPIVCQLHDPLTVAAMVDRRFVTTRRARVSVALLGDHVRTFEDHLEGHEAEIVTGVNGEAFATFWLETVLG